MFLDIYAVDDNYPLYGNVVSPQLAAGDKPAELLKPVDRATLVALPTQRQAQRFALNVLIAFLPAVLLGLVLGKAIKEHLFTPSVVATTFHPARLKRTPHSTSSQNTK